MVTIDPSRSHLICSTVLQSISDDSKRRERGRPPRSKPSSTNLIWIQSRFLTLRKLELQAYFLKLTLELEFLRAGILIQLRGRGPSSPNFTTIFFIFSLFLFLYCFYYTHHPTMYVARISKGRHVPIISSSNWYIKGISRNSSKFA